MNKLEAKVSKIKSKQSLNLVSFSFNTNTLTMISLDLDEKVKEDKQVLLSIKPTNITLAKNFEGLLSSSNKLLGKISNLEIGELLSSVICDVNGTLIEAVITTNSLEKMNLSLNEDIVLLFKASDLAIMEISND
ncbi:TOBE domain-containing protein [Halarcobacter sp.]|uniref:TOBE domain-containing protein n=1 Tax=Halarcobacter TaxID=2321115 RepID=UPI003A941998